MHLPPVPLTFLVALASLTVTSGAQSTFTKLSPGTSPPARSQHGMLFSSHDNKIVLFGGRLVGNPRTNETWTFDGSNWQQEAPTSVPGVRQYPGMVYDFVRARVFMFGGHSGSGYLGDMWSWDGSDWTQLNPANPVPAREKTGLAFDVPRLNTVLFGGVHTTYRSSAGHDYGDTWTFDGTDWTQVTPATNPPTRFAHTMCYDKNLGKVIMLGGFGWNVTPSARVSHNDMWAWDGTDWAKLKPRTLPGHRMHASMHFDDALGRVVLIGGVGVGNLVTDEIWEWDGEDWARREPLSRPAVTNGGAAFHAGANKTIQFGGAPANATGKPDLPNPVSDTWEYASTAPATHTSFGTGCTGSAGIATLSATAPWIGEAFVVTVSNLPVGAPAFLYLSVDRTSSGGVPLPLDLAFLGAPGCSLLVAPLLQFGLFNPAGEATLSIPLPNTAALNGVTFFTQSYGADPAANAAGLVVSNAGEEVVGIR